MFDGSARKRKDGRYELQITIGIDDMGKRKRKSFYGATEREVKRKRDAWIKDTNNNINTGFYSHNTIGFSSWANTWLEVYKKPTVRPYTYLNTYKTRVDKYLIPYFGERPIDSITQMDIQKFFNNHKFLSMGLLNTLKVILNGIFKKAISNNHCIKNPVTDISISSSYVSSEKRYYNTMQQRLAIEWAKKNKEYDILIILKTGVRRGELLGLKWCDIDFKQNTININQSISPKVKGEEDKLLKNISSKRTIPIDEELAGCIKDIPCSGEYLFQATSVDAFAKKLAKKLKRMSSECGIPLLTPHELRHTFGTVLREKGVDIYTISKLLGHSSIGVTASIYVHNDIEVLRKAICR